MSSCVILSRIVFSVYLQSTLHRDEYTQMKVITDFEQFKNKKVLFITTKNLDYIRNVQECQLIEAAAANMSVIGHTGKHYPARLTYVYLKLLFTDFKRYDEVFIGFAPQAVLPFFLHRIKKAGCHVTVDFFLSVYDTFCLDRKQIRRNSPAGRLIHRLDEMTLKASDNIICDTMAHGQFFIEEFNAVKDKLSVLYLSALGSIYTYRDYDREEVFQELFGQGCPDGRIILYFGSVLPLQGAETVYEAMHILAASHDNICIFIGPLKRLNITAYDSSILHADHVSQEALSRLVAISDVCLAGHFSADIDKAKRTIPGKAFIYEAMGKPMILGDNEANREFFKPDCRHIYVPHGDAAAIARAVMKIL